MPPRPRNLKLPLSAFTSSPAAEELSSGPVFKSTIDASVDVAVLKDEAGLGFEAWTTESGRKVAGGVAVVRSVPGSLRGVAREEGEGEKDVGLEQTTTVPPLFHAPRANLSASSHSRS